MASLPDEKDLVVIVWANLSEKSVSRGRPYETMTKHGSWNPVAWRLSFLRGKYSGLLQDLTVLKSEDEVKEHLSLPKVSDYSRSNPVLVPVSLARSVLGWNEFDVWEDDHNV